ncbi:MAG: molecular chaperone TorD, partial [Candidatus Electrothrix sp. AR3]|nr:molecular chaperone TorD [Candidatus Electrothrix sp. AR3]
MDVQEKTDQSNCYKVLAACFYEPDKELFEEEQLVQQLAVMLRRIAPAAEPAALALAQALGEGDAEALCIDYARLFIGPFELLAPPYGSVYLEKNKQVMGASTMDVQQAYQQAGLTLTLQEPPDHIAFELEFLAYLAALEGKALAKGEPTEQERLAQMKQDFLDTLLAPWIPIFCQKIKDNATQPFYQHLAECLEKTVAQFSAAQCVSF